MKIHYRIRIKSFRYKRWRENATKISKITSFLCSKHFISRSQSSYSGLYSFSATHLPPSLLKQEGTLSHQVKKATLSVPQTRRYTFSSRPSYYLFLYQEGSSQRYAHPYLLLQVCLNVILSKCPFLSNLLKQYPY